MNTGDLWDFGKDNWTWLVGCFLICIAVSGVISGITISLSSEEETAPSHPYVNHYTGILNEVRYGAGYNDASTQLTLNKTVILVSWNDTMNGLILGHFYTVDITNDTTLIRIVDWNKVKI